MSLLGIVADSIRTTAAEVLEVGAADFTVAQQGVNDILGSALTETQLEQVRTVPGVSAPSGSSSAPRPSTATTPL